MRLPHVYERSAPREHRDVEQESQDDYVAAARATIAALPALLWDAEAAGAVALGAYRELPNEL